MLALLRLESTCNNSKFNFCLIIRVLCARSRETYDNGGERGLLLIRGNVFFDMHDSSIRVSSGNVVDRHVYRARKKTKKNYCL